MQEAFGVFVLDPPALVKRRHDLDRGVRAYRDLHVQAFRRAECSDNKLTVTLRGLEPEATYCLEDLENGETRKLAGRELMEQGLEITLAEQPSAAVIVYRRE